MRLEWFPQVSALNFPRGWLLIPRPLRLHFPFLQLLDARHLRAKEIMVLVGWTVWGSRILKGVTALGRHILGGKTLLAPEVINLCSVSVELGPEVGEELGELTAECLGCQLVPWSASMSPHSTMASPTSTNLGLTSGVVSGSISWENSLDMVL